MKISQTPGAVIPLKQRVTPSGGPAEGRGSVDPARQSMGSNPPPPPPPPPNITMGDGSNKLATMIGEVTFRKGPIVQVWAEAQNQPGQTSHVPNMRPPLMITGAITLKQGADTIAVDTASALGQARPADAPRRSLPADPASGSRVSLQGGPAMSDGAGAVILMPDGTYRPFHGFGGT